MYALLLSQTRVIVIFSSAVVFVCVSGIAEADQFSTRYGQSTCTETVDNSDGRSLEFYGEVDTSTDEANIGFKYIIEFQKPNTRINRCDSMHNLTLQRMRMDLERQRLELEALREGQEVRKTETQGRLEADW